MIGKLTVCLLSILLPAYVCAAGFTCNGQRFLSSNQALDLYCLSISYPEIRAITRLPDGNALLMLDNEQTVPYSETQKAGRFSDLAESMRIPYPLEPNRPEIAPANSPGRKRPYRFFYAAYGDNRQAVGRNMLPLTLFGKSLHFAPAAAKALSKVASELSRDDTLRPWLKPDGGFYWRKIAGEEVLSAHSFGIAVDLSAHKAPYWRWSKINPHPLQKTYPAKIVQAMENAGFIWGGKWHEYDLMHFEYRPELICKSRIKRAQAQAPGRSKARDLP